MKETIFDKFHWVLTPMLVGLALSVSSCKEDIDESDLYTFTGETIQSFIQKDETLTSFDYILTRANLHRRMSSYGQYTCYAPTNEGVAQYIDSLWHDKEAEIDRNGMTSNSLEGLSDSLCVEIAKYHLADQLYSIVSMSGVGTTITTMLNYPMSAAVNANGETILNGESVILSYDNEVVNGLVHKISKVVPRKTRKIGDTFNHITGYTIFAKALQVTGLADSMLNVKKDKVYTIADRTDTGGQILYWPEECKYGYTVFAVPDAVLKEKYGLDPEDPNVIAKFAKVANDKYANAPDWYDYMAEKGLTVSTGDDYTNRWNALNMLISYHCLNVGMAQDQMVFEKKLPVSKTNWNYVNGGEPYDYFITMLPNTLIKIWEPDPHTTKTLYINRYEAFNTLTDEIGTMGSDALHQVKRHGVKIIREGQQMAYNGYIQEIEDLLIYDEMVPKGVLHERLRFEATTFIPEFINNGIRYLDNTACANLNAGGSGARVAFSQDYFDGVVCYSAQSTLRYNVKGQFRLYQSDSFQGWGQYDLAIKMPPLPTNTYEMRLLYSPMAHGGMMQFYLGNSSNQQEMIALDIPLDVRIEDTDPRIGWTTPESEDDRGVATDAAMRNRGYMRGPMSYKGHMDLDQDALLYNCRNGDNGPGLTVLRRILCMQEFKQSNEHWLRIKSVIHDDTDLKWQLDFVEFVPRDVVENSQYSEDWY